MAQYCRELPHEASIRPAFDTPGTTAAPYIPNGSTLGDIRKTDRHLGLVLESAVAYIGPQVAILKAPPEDKYESDSELIEGESNQG